ncbi:LacI family DNA-binding transcriptional regulator [Variovorax sp. KK3]|uniref:LacI family DNA-binding transcriptional regulator n=1 Tax=Variovorax sp. KK3 TaxID=1855728 RepID=UPI00097CA86C|nr:LacI family DNA-binding transcriptional regulator [Variovorax sp. KK3]
MDKRRITINDIAEHSGVSRSTVSLVLQGHPRIPQATGDKVRRSMAELGYTYNRAAANLRRQTSQAIGLIVNDLRNPFFAELTSAIQARVENEGYFVYLVESGEDLDRQERLLQSLVEHGVAGLVVCPATATPGDAFDRQLAAGIPLCLAVRPHPDQRIDYAGSDNYGGALMATRHLVEAGHRRIAFLGGQQENPVRVDRLAGYFSALQGGGIPFDPALVTDSRPTLHSGADDLKTVLALAQPPTALLCYNDYVAIGVMHALRCNGLVPGEDIAVVGFDGMPETAVTFPPLSTVELHGQAVGERAAELLLARIADPSRSPARHVEQATLIARSSSAPQRTTAPGDGDRTGLPKRR